jgi:hypothetical protein
MQSKPVNTGLELAVSLKANGDRVDVLLAMPPDELAFSDLSNGRRKAELIVGYSVLPDGDHEQTKRSTTPAELVLDAMQFEKARNAGALLVLQPQLPPGAGTLRVAVTDTHSQRVGSIDLRYPPKPAAKAEANLEAYTPEDGPDILYEGTVIPETGTLSAGQYTNLYFGFHLRLPRQAVVSKLLQHLPPKGVHALAGLLLRDGRQIGVIGVFAIDSSAGLALDPEQAANDEIDKAKSEGRVVRAGPGVRTIGKASCVFNEIYNPSRHENTYFYYVRRGDYLVKLAATAESNDLLSRLKDSLDHMEFTDSSRAVIASGAELYEGPTIPTGRIDALLAAKPGAMIADALSVSGSSFADPKLGFRYAFPAGWSITQRDVFSDYHRV